jgi:hypothetical protein
MGSNTTKGLGDFLLPGYFVGLLVYQLTSLSVSSWKYIITNAKTGFLHGNVRT